MGVLGNKFGKHFFSRVAVYLSCTEQPVALTFPIILQFRDVRFCRRGKPGEVEGTFSRQGRDQLQIEPTSLKRIPLCLLEKRTNTQNYSTQVQKCNQEMQRECKYEDF